MKNSRPYSKASKDQQRALEPVRAYDPYQPRAFLTREEFGAKYRYKQTAEIEGWFDGRPVAERPAQSDALDVGVYLNAAKYVGQQTAKPKRVRKSRST
ncbi:hypothetical protein [Brucella pseudogrignonensis]|uniref:Uncharacterized protein n=1 Tax=Brucella pseudogrignonensis TaxID=419475 RepID=A0ABU1M619_9HYPH|nr:hypothetical protein [Brucella pseudogrignonensis]MDR6431277.1 hypothetical protein [Brucella pseudogrignonensis]